MLHTLTLFDHNLEHDLLFAEDVQVDLCDSLSTFQPLIPDDEQMNICSCPLSVS